ncbi:hypothetical protein [Tahibacter amnicola]|uniref:Uncharacterized protein n=1 Tax=Tahibacter amnicola TaxID=2976241 RepID=A0ABY6BB30_9GAMM|nr:hypothetical protein [Tahibacter amnicola]UXI67065.1 hypothetical protein N4264_20270 [Tahibacter amnicola]
MTKKSVLRDDDASSDESPPAYSIHDLLASPYGEKPDLPRLIAASRYCRDGALASLRTLAHVLRLLANRDESTESDVVHDFGKLVAHFADFADAVSVLESHADYAAGRRNAGSIEA